MASRSPRVFQAQFRLLLVTSQLEAAEARLGEAVALGRRLRALWLRREVHRLWDAVEAERRRLAPPPWREIDPRVPQPGLGAPELLHVRLRPYVRFGPDLEPRGFGLPDDISTARRAAMLLTASGSLASIALTMLEIARHGISDRPSLVVAELVAIVLSPLAIALTAAAAPSPR